jgi:hypothetical protein
MTGVGSGVSILVSAGAVAVPGLLGVIGSMLWLIGALKDLADCLKRMGKEEEAARLLKRIEVLEQEVERLKKLAPGAAAASAAQ